MRPDLDSLSLFVLAVEMRSLTKAAEASFMSLPAASRRMALLEERLGAPVLMRTPRGVMATEAGTVLLAHAKDLLLGVNRLRADMNSFARGSAGVLRILATTSAITHTLPQDLAEFGARHPDIRISIGEEWSEAITRNLTDLKADVGIVVEGCRTSDLGTRPYDTYRIGVVMPRDHLLALAKGFSFQDVLDHDIVALEKESLMMRSLQEQAMLVQRPLTLRVEVKSFDAVCKLVQSGLGLGLVPLEPSIGLAHALGLEIRPLPEDWAERRMLVCYRREHQRSPALTTLVDHLASRWKRVQRIAA